MARRWLIVAAVLSLAAPAVAAPRPFTVAPRPSWVKELPIPAGATRPPGDAVRVLLSDVQARVGASQDAHYFRMVRQILTSDGLDALSHLAFEFHSYDQLILHYVRILRGGRVIEALRPDEVRIVHSERKLAEEMLQGTSSAVIVLSDLRAGDTLDYAFTVAGRNPIYGGYVVDRADLALATPVERLHRRWIAPRALGLVFQGRGTAASPVVSEHGDEREYVLDVADVPAITIEGDLPAWYDPSPWLEVSSFASWSEVARWAANLFAERQRLSPALVAQIDAWRALPSAEQRVLAALSFVRNDVRYFGIEIGENALLPHPPSEVFAKRFGDCKDKALLLVTVLRGLGFDARPALINTLAGATLDDWLPSAGAFDHVIVQLRFGGRTQWLDPTQSFQRGTLATLASPGFARALIVDPETAGLANMEAPAESQPTQTVEEHYRVAGTGDGAELEVVTHYRADEADRVRQNLAGRASSLAGVYLNYYANRDPRIESLAPPVIDDDTAADVVTITERYRIPDFWINGEHQLVADIVRGEIRRPAILRRHMPLAVRYPVLIDQTLRIDMPDPGRIEREERTFEDDAIRFHYDAHRGDASVVLHYRFESLRDAVPAADVDKHLALLDQINDYLGYRLITRKGDASGGTWVGLGILAALLGLVGLYRLAGYLRRRLRKRRLRRRFDQPEGQSAATAIRVDGRQAVARRLGRLSCRCRRTFDPSTSGEERVRYGDKTLLVVQLQCAVCGERARLYFDLAA